jgi:hypothetical protein
VTTQTLIKKPFKALVIEITEVMKMVASTVGERGQSNHYAMSLLPLLDSEMA